MSLFSQRGPVNGLRIALSSGVPGVPDGGDAFGNLRVAEMLVQAGQAAYRLWGNLAVRDTSVDGLTWSYLDGGRGETVLLVHGFGADKYRFGPIVPHLSRFHRVVVPDLPGFGESAKGTSLPYDIKSQARRLARFVDAAGLGRFHLVGLSMGGYLSALYAAKYPERVRRLVLIDAAGVRSPRPSFMLRRFEKDGTILLLYRSRSQFDDLLAALFYSPPWIPGPIKDLTVRQALINFDLRVKVLADLFEGGTDLLDSRLGDIRAQTLILWGADDRIVDPSSVEIFTRGIHNSRAVVMDKCGHIPIIEKWRESSRICREFLKVPGR